MKKVLILCGAGLLLAASVFAVQQYQNLQAEQKGRQLLQQTEFTRASDAFYASTAQLELQLSKLPLCDEPEKAGAALMEITRQAQSCVHAAEQLPIDPASGESAIAFFRRIQDYARSLLPRILQGQPLGDRDLTLLSSIGATCAKLSDPVETADFSSLTADVSFPLPEEDTGELYPVMIYDGPFSENEQKQPVLGLTGEEATQKEALARAAQILNTEISALTVEGEEQGDMPGWILAHGETRLLLSKKGLKLIWLLSEKKGDEPESLSLADAIEAAKAYARELGFAAEYVTWHQVYSGCAVICLAPMEKGAILYPDLVKVKIDLADGSLLGWDARRYIRCHAPRELPEPNISREEAIALAPALLRVEACTLAFIEPDGLDPALTWELRGICQGNRFYVYLNAQSGEIEEILREVSSPEGGAAA